MYLLLYFYRYYQRVYKASVRINGTLDAFSCQRCLSIRVRLRETQLQVMLLQEGVNDNWRWWCGGCWQKNPCLPFEKLFQNLDFSFEIKARLRVNDAGILQYVEDLRQGINADIARKDFLKMASTQSETVIFNKYYIVYLDIYYKLYHVNNQLNDKINIVNYLIETAVK